MNERLIEMLVDPDYGLVSELRQLSLPPGYPMAYYIHALSNGIHTLRDGPAIEGRGGSGCARTRDRAQGAAIGEAVERYCADIASGHQIIRCSWNELDAEALDPATITRYRPEQYGQDGFPYSPVDRDTQLDWVSGHDLTTSRDCLIPAGLVFLSWTRKPVIRELISTGLACGPALETAILSGIHECVERDAFTITWLGRLPVPRIPTSDVAGLLDDDNRDWGQGLLDAFQSHGINVCVSDITTDLGIPAFMITLADPVRRPHLYISTAANVCAASALRGALEEAMEGYLWAKMNLDARTEPPPAIGQCTGMKERTLSYAWEAEFGAVDFILDAPLAATIPESCTTDGSPGALAERLRSCGVDTLWAELTTPDIRSVGLHVVRAVCPQLQYLHNLHPMLQCDRLYSVPKRMGYPPVTGLNPRAHPFP